MNKPISAETMETIPAKPVDMEQSFDLADLALAGAQMSLAEQAGDSPRSQVMKEIVGPVMTKFLQPIYEQSFDDEEKKKLAISETFIPILTSIHNHTLKSLDFYTKLSEAAVSILADRVETARVGDSDQVYTGIDELNRQRGTLFFYDNPDNILHEGLRTGASLPLTIALQIAEIEGRRAQARSAGHNPLKIIEIMQRESFDKMLLQLTKGPNGFLGAGSDDLNLEEHFFQFRNAPYDTRLEIRAAYKVKNDIVIGLSDAYHMAANKKRKKLIYNINDGAISSSGCPVRHRFEDESGELQQSLIITAKNFLIEALKSGAENNPS